MEINITCTLEELKDPHIQALLGIESSDETATLSLVTDPDENAGEEPPKPRKKAKAKAKKKEPETETETETGDGRERLANVFQELIQDGQRETALSLLSDAGVKRVHEVLEEDIEDIIKKAEAALI